MNSELDRDYLEWLYSQVGSVKDRVRARTHWNLLTHIFSKEFVWLVANDDNRLEDGRDLRDEYLHERGLDRSDVSWEWLNQNCSLLEMLIALSRRLSFEIDVQPKDCFWLMINNLGISVTDNVKYPQKKIDEILDSLIWRRYHHDGKGGLFPLKYPTKDQRDVEIWYQLSAYLLENNY